MSEELWPVFTENFVRLGYFPSAARDFIKVPVYPPLTAADFSVNIGVPETIQTFVLERREYFPSAERNNPWDLRQCWKVPLEYTGMAKDYFKRKPTPSGELTENDGGG